MMNVNLLPADASSFKQTRTKIKGPKPSQQHFVFCSYIIPRVNTYKHIQRAESRGAISRRSSSPFYLSYRILCIDFNAGPGQRFHTGLSIFNLPLNIPLRYQSWLRQTRRETAPAPDTYSEGTSYTTEWIINCSQCCSKWGKAAKSLNNSRFKPSQSWGCGRQLHNLRLKGWK